MVECMTSCHSRDCSEMVSGNTSFLDVGLVPDGRDKYTILSHATYLDDSRCAASKIELTVSG